MHTYFSMKHNLGSDLSSELDLILGSNLILVSDLNLLPNLILGSDFILIAILFWKRESQFNSTQQWDEKVSGQVHHQHTMVQIVNLMVSVITGVHYQSFM